MNANNIGVGGAISMSNQAVLHGRSILLTNNMAKLGGAIHADDSLVDIIGGVVISNKATQNGGAMYIHIKPKTIFRNDLLARVDQSSLERNTAQVGGGLYKYLNCLILCTESTSKGWPFRCA